ncbi:hypothetical protein ABPG74_009949 [Tetrahymena malaccensis]
MPYDLTPKNNNVSSQLIVIDYIVGLVQKGQYFLKLTVIGYSDSLPQATIQAFDRKNPCHTSKAQINPSDVATQKLSRYAEQNETLIVAGKQGFVIAYDTTIKFNCKQIGSTILETEIINSIFISQDSKWLYVAADSIGMQIYQLKDNSVDQPSNGLNQRSLNFIFAAFAKFNSELMQIIVTSTNQIYGFGKYQGFFLSDSLSLIQANQSQFPLLLKFKNYWPSQSILPVIQSMLINQKETLLLLGVRSQGLYIFDINKQDQIKLLQKIDFDFPIYSLQFSVKENYLYVSNGQSLITLNQIQTNLNNDFPNLFNYHQVKFDQFSGAYKWRCYTDPSDTYLIGAFDYQGLYVFPYYKNPYRLNMTNSLHIPMSLDSLTIDPSDKYLIIPLFSNPSLLGIYQYKPLDNSPEQQKISPMNLVLTKLYKANQTQITEAFNFSLDKTLAVQTYAVGLILYNSKDILNLYVYSFWQYPDFLSGENQGACITRDNKWILSTIRVVAIYLLNIEDKTNPVLANYLMNLGSETIYISQFFDYAYLVDGIKGFAIIDTTSFPNINIISRANLQGYALTMMLLEQENYVLVSQLEKGLVSLIDIRDKQFPQVITSLTYESETAEAICSNKNKDYIFIGATNGMMTMPLKSDVLIHTDAYLVTSIDGNGGAQLSKFSKTNWIGDANNPSLQNEYIFFIGQVVKLYFTLLYLQTQNMQIKNAFLYQQGQKVNLPSFIIFDQVSQSLQITVNQQLLGNNYNNLNLNIILLWTVIPLDQNSFIYTSEDSLDIAVTTTSQSALIFQYLIDQNILDSSGVIDSQHDFIKNVKLDSQIQSQIFDSSLMPSIVYQILIDQLTLKINLSLKRSCYTNPIKTYVKSSLQFDNNNFNQFISSVEEQNISITLQINSTDGQLLKIDQTNVISYMQTNQDQLKIQGNLADVNSVLKKKIIFANNTEITQKNSPNITITIVDNINYPLVQTYSIYNSNFIVLKKQLKANNENLLQHQINQQFKDGIVDINTSIDIFFSSNSFIVDDSKDLTYQVFLLDKYGEYVKFPSDFWLQQQNNKLSFKGSTTTKMYYQIYRFKIEASDGYTKTEDYFFITVKGIPFAYILNLMLTVLGPAAAAFGIYKQRFSLYNIIYKDQVTFSVEEIFCGQVFHKEIVTVGQTQQLAQEILNQLFKFIMNNNKKKNQNQFQDDNSNKHLKSDNKTLTNSYFSEQNQQDNLSGGQIEILEGKSEVRRIKSIQSLNKIQTHTKKSILEKRYLEESGKLMFFKVIDDIIKQKILPNIQVFESEEIYQREIKNENSRIHKCIRALISRYFLNLDKRTLQVYDYVKNYSIENLKKTKYDWAKALVQIIYMKDEENYQKNMMNFPQLKLQYNQLIQVLKTIQLFPDQIKSTTNKFKDFIELFQTHQVNINPFLLREVLFAEALGFSQIQPSKFYPSIGQSIHLNAYDISQVLAFKKRHLSEWVKPIYKALNMEYTRYGMSKNIKLPQWIYLDQKYGKIFFHGIPQDYDIEEILIRIYDKNKYVVQQFLLKIKFDFKNQQNYQLENIDNDDIFSIADEKEDQINSDQNENFAKYNIDTINKCSFQYLKKGKQNKLDNIMNLK